MPKQYTAGSVRLLAAGLTKHHELSPEARATAGQALADYADLLDKLSAGEKKRPTAPAAEKRERMKTDPATVGNRERARSHRAKKAE